MARGNQLIVVHSSSRPAETKTPKMIVDAGDAARFAWEEYFLGKVRNKHTRAAYLRSMRRFLNWPPFAETDLTRTTPGMVGQYLDELPVSIPSKKLHLAAIRSFLDVLVQRHVIVLNPSLSVRAPRYSAFEGKTSEITVEQCRRLLASIRLDRPVDFRDRAVIAVLIYTAARVGVVASLRVRDFAHDGTQFTVRFAEKGGKSRLIPVRADLERFIHEYVIAGGLADAAISAIDICRMVKRRLKRAGLRTSRRLIPFAPARRQTFSCRVSPWRTCNISWVIPTAA